MSMPVYTLPRFECLFCGINVFAVLNPGITVPHGALFKLCFGDYGMAEIHDSHANPRVVYLCERCVSKVDVGVVLVQTDPPLSLVKQINFNGVDLQLEKEELTYDDVVELYKNCHHKKRGPDPFFKPVLSVTYARGHLPKLEGMIEPGGSVRLKDGMVISAFITSSA